jgi:alpha-D-xyloside xylohydrolase
MNYRGKTQWLDQANMEVALPFLLSNKGYGILWDNYSRTLFDGALASASQYKFESESGPCIDYYFMYGENPDGVIAAYRLATGDAPMFPKWAYGLFQSMDRYENCQDLFRVSQTYREKQIPFDCIVQDWRYWDPYPWGSHMMNEASYPDPKTMIDSLHRMNVHTMISIWPIHTEGDTYFTEFESIKANYPSSGTHHYYDPHNTKARIIYWRQLNERLFGKYGWDGWWADGCEPETWPDTYDCKAFTTALGPGTEYYNTYPLMHTTAVYEGWRNDITGKRLFTLSRSAFSGQQRNATAVWSGDIKSNWEDFRKQLSAGLNFSLSGMPYWTTDIGGYWGTDWTLPANRELFTRWFQFGAFCPIFRIHGKLERTLYSEQSWDVETRKNLLVYDRLRYRLMPYIYSLAWKVTHEQYTIMRQLVMDYPIDKNIQNIDDQFMFGPALLVNPVINEGITERSVYLPKGQWFDFWTGEKLTGGKTIKTAVPVGKLPLFVKSGSILPMGPDIQYANESIDPLEIRIYEGADGKFNLYEDEGDAYNYENGSYSIIPLRYKDKTSELTIGEHLGNYNGMPTERTFKIVKVKFGNGVGVEVTENVGKIVKYLGKVLKVKLE